MTPEDLHALMNRLLEAERAGAKLLAAYLRELQPGSELHARLDAVQRDEARNCAVLIHHLLECGAVPSAATGDFYERGLAIREWSERLAFLNRGQGWVARKIAAALPELEPGPVRQALEAMHASHLVNIRACEAVLT